MRTLLLLLFLCLFSYSQKLHVMTEELPPYGYYENDSLTGLTVEIVREIFTILDIEDSIHVYPWARAYMNIQNEPNQVLFAMARTAEREDLFTWVGPLFSDRVFFYKKRGSDVEISTIEEAGQVDKILITRDFPQHAILIDKGFTNLYLTANQEQDLRMLHAEHGDLIVIGESVIKEVAQEVGIPDTLFEKTIMLFQTDLYIAFSKETSHDIVQQWQNALDQIRKSGRYAEIVEQYIH